MSGLDGMTIWIPDFIAGTQSLSTTELGAFMLILCAMWTAKDDGYLPNDPKKLARIARLTSDKWKKVEPAVMELLVVDGDRVTCKRLLKELGKTRKRIEQKREAGRSRHGKEEKIPPCEMEKSSPGPDAGNDAKPLKDQERNAADAERTQSERPSETPGTLDSDSFKKDSFVPSGEGTSAKRSTKPTKKDRYDKSYSPDFDQFWAVYPVRAGSRDKKDAWAAFQIALDNGTSAELIIAAAAKYAEQERQLNHINTIYVKMAVVWLNKRCWEDFGEAAGGTSTSVPINPGTPQWDAWRAHWQSNSFCLRQMDAAVDRREPFYAPQEWPPSLSVMTKPGTPQWDRWRAHYVANGQNFRVRKMDESAEQGEEFPMPQEWPPDQIATAA